MDKKEYQAGQKTCGIKVGDTVKVLRKAEKGEDGWNNSWEPKMNKCIGKTFKVVRINDTDIKSDCPREYGFPYFVLEKIET